MPIERVHFVQRHVSVEHVPIWDGYKFKPKGRFNWPQRKAWAWLMEIGALTPAYEPVLKETYVSFHPDDFIKALHREQRSLLEEWGQTAGKLLIGAQDFDELMGTASMGKSDWCFWVQLFSERKALGLQVHVIPWMRGFIVMP